MKTLIHSRLFQTAAFATALVITGSVTPNSVQAQNSVYENAILSYEPAGYWPLTETSGTTTTDLTGNNDGTYINCQLGQPGLPDSEGIGTNSSVYFSGDEAYVDIPGSGNLNIEGPVTVIQWIQAPVGGDTTFVTTLGHSDDSYRLDVVPQAHFACPAPDVVDETPLNDGKWHMLAGVFDGSTEYLYVDGYLAASVAETGFPFSDDDVWIGGAPDYGDRFFTGNICQVAIIPSALEASDILGLLYSLETPPQISISPSAPSIYAGSNLKLTTTVLGNPALSYQWFEEVAGVTNLIPEATNSTYTVENTPLSDDGAVFGVIATNDYGTNSVSVTLAVANGPAYIAQDLSPVTAEALVGTPITYTIGAAGTMPLYYQWTVNGTTIAGATASTLTTAAVAGNNNLQVTVTNAETGGSPAISSVAAVTGVTTPISVSFGTENWTLNSDGFGSVPSFLSTNDLELTDGGGSEASSAFYNLAEYVAAFTASFTYTAQDAGADGTCFIIQNSTLGVGSLGAAGGSLGFAGAIPDITNSVALEIDLYSFVGIGVGSNGNTFATDSILYGPTGGIFVNSGDPITFDLAYTNSVLYVNMTDQSTATTYSTNYDIGPMTTILGGTDLAYIGFSGGTGGLASIQDVTDFVFQPILQTTPPTPPTLSGLLTDGHLQLSWATNSVGFTVQSTTSLTPPVEWTSVSGSPTLSGSAYLQTVTNATSPASFFRLIHTQ